MEYGRTAYILTTLLQYGDEKRWSHIGKILNLSLKTCRNMLKSSSSSSSSYYGTTTAAGQGLPVPTSDEVGLAFSDLLLP